MFEPLDGPSAQLKITAIGTVTPVEAKAGGTALKERKVLTLQPNGNIKVYFADDSVPSAATVAANGLNHFKDAKETYEAGYQQKVYLLAVAGTVDVVVVERA